MKNAVAYIRVSSVEQVKYGGGKDMQIASITEWAKDHDYNMVRWFIEEDATSGKTMVESRVAYVALEDYLAHNEEDVVTCIVYNTDRLARLNWLQGKILFEFEARGLVIESITQPDIMTDNPDAKLLAQIQAAFAEFESSKNVARMKDGRVNRARKGGHAVGAIPTGYKSIYDEVAKEKKLVMDEEEAETVRLIFELKLTKGLSYQKIADKLNSMGLKPKNWKPEKPSMWHNSSIQVIYKNPKYYGYVELYETQGKGLNKHRVRIVRTENMDLKIV